MDPRDTDRDWKRVAELDPFWGVLSQDQFRKAEMTPERFAQFMGTGQRYIADLLGLVRAHIDPDFRLERALDFGCGVGRILIPLAGYVKEAVGVDVAPGMLALCRKHADAAKVTNITLVESNDTLDGVEGTFDFVNSYIVLQHIEPARGFRLLRMLIERLPIGGIASLQVTYAKSRDFMKHEAPQALFYRRDGDKIMDLVASDWTPPEGTIKMFDYDLNHLFALFTRYAGHPMIVLPTDNGGHLGLHCVFRRAR